MISAPYDIKPGDLRGPDGRVVIPTEETKDPWGKRDFPLYRKNPWFKRDAPPAPPLEEPPPFSVPRNDGGGEVIDGGGVLVPLPDEYPQDDPYAPPRPAPKIPKYPKDIPDMPGGPFLPPGQDEYRPGPMVPPWFPPIEFPPPPQDYRPGPTVPPWGLPLPLPQNDQYRPGPMVPPWGPPPWVYGTPSPGIPLRQPAVMPQAPFYGSMGVGGAAISPYDQRRMLLRALFGYSNR